MCGWWVGGGDSCVCEREREREREIVCVCLTLCVCVGGGGGGCCWFGCSIHDDIPYIPQPKLLPRTPRQSITTMLVAYVCMLTAFRNTFIAFCLLANNTDSSHHQVVFDCITLFCVQRVDLVNKESESRI